MLPILPDVKNVLGKLVLRVLDCRLDAALSSLVGVVVCEAALTLDNVFQAYLSLHDLMLEFNLIKFSHLTKFTENR